MKLKLILASLLLAIWPTISHSQVKEPRFSGDAIAARTDGSILSIRSEPATYSLSNVLTIKGGKSVSILPSGQPLKFVVRVKGEDYERTQESWFHIFKLKTSGGKRTVQISADYSNLNDIEIQSSVVRHGVSSFSMTVDELAPGEYCIWKTSSFISLLNSKHDVITFSVE